MPAYAPSYSTRQKAAAVAALLGGLTSRQVCERAAQGLLRDAAGPLEPFELAASTLRDWKRQERDASAQPLSELQQAPPRDAVERLRLDLIGVAEAAIGDLKRQAARKPGEVDFERLRQAGRALREAAAIPGRDDLRPVAPGEKLGDGTGRNNGDKTRGGLAGSILAAHRGGRSDGPPVMAEPPAPAPPEPPPAPKPAIDEIDEWLDADA